MNPTAEAEVAPTQGVFLLDRVGNTPLLRLSRVGRDFSHSENTAVKESDAVSIVPSIAGGKGLKPQIHTDEHRFSACTPQMAWPPVILPALSAVEGSGAKDLLFLPPRLPAKQILRHSALSREGGFYRSDPAAEGAVFLGMTH